MLAPIPRRSQSIAMTWKAAALHVAAALTLTIPCQFAFGDCTTAGGAISTLTTVGCTISTASSPLTIDAGGQCVLDTWHDFQAERISLNTISFERGVPNDRFEAGAGVAAQFAGHDFRGVEATAGIKYSW